MLQVTSITYDHTIYKIQFTVYASGKKTVNNVETTTYSIKDVKVNRIVDGTRTEINNPQYDNKNSKFKANTLKQFRSSL